MSFLEPLILTGYGPTRSTLTRSQGMAGSASLGGNFPYFFEEVLHSWHFLQVLTCAWVHQCLSHPGSTRMEKTIGRLFTWTGMRNDIRRHRARVAFLKKLLIFILCFVPSQHGHTLDRDIGLFLLQLRRPEPSKLFRWKFIGFFSLNVLVRS